jgi:hypothetical protein
LTEWVRGDVQAKESLPLLVIGKGDRASEGLFKRFLPELVVRAPLRCTPTRLPKLMQRSRRERRDGRTRRSS